MDEDKFGAWLLYTLIGFIFLYGSYHIGRYHQKHIDYAESCEESVVCKQVKKGLECRRVKL